MSMHSNLLVLGAAGLFLISLPALAKVPAKARHKTPPTETAIIENTGSTNTKGYQIKVSSTGGAFLEGKVLDLPMAASTQLFQDLAAAMPLSRLPVRHGMRSASFGTRTYVTYRGERSPDLTFGGDAHATALKEDIAAITQALHVSNAPRRPVTQPVAPPPETH